MIIVLIVAAIAVSIFLGWRLGYHHGYVDCDFEHDFDKCPHCGEPIVPEDRDTTID